MANTTPPAPKTVGRASETTTIAATAASTTNLVRSSSGSRRLVSRAYPAHVHHRTDSTSRPRSNPFQVGSSDSNPVTWVKAKTNKRSKNSSSGVTRAFPSATGIIGDSGSVGASLRQRDSKRGDEELAVAVRLHAAPSALR